MGSSISQVTKGPLISQVTTDPILNQSISSKEKPKGLQVRGYRSKLPYTYTMCILLYTSLIQSILLFNL